MYVRMSDADIAFQPRSPPQPHNPILSSRSPNPNMSTINSLDPNSLDARRSALLSTLLSSIAFASTYGNTSSPRPDEEDPEEPSYLNPAPGGSTATAPTVRPKRVRFDESDSDPASGPSTRASSEETQTIRNGQDGEETITATDAQAEDVEDVEENSASRASTARDNAERKPSPAPTQQYKSERSASYSPRERHKVERSSRSHSRSNATWTFTFRIDSHRSSHRDGHPSTRDRSRHHRGEPPATRASQRSSTFGDSAYSSVSSVAPYLIGAGAAFILSNRSAITNGLSAWTSGR